MPCETSDYMFLIFISVLFLGLVSPLVQAQGIRFDATYPLGVGPNNSVSAMDRLPDGRIWVGGSFTSFQGTTANRLVRLLPNGQRDTALNMGSGADARINVIRVLPDGKVYIGGLFFIYNNLAAKGVARLLPDGSFDTQFQMGQGFNNEVLALEPLADSGLLVGGFFSQFQQMSVAQPVKLLPNGQRDTTFNQGGTGTTGIIDAILQQPDGRILVGGAVTAYNGQSVSRLFRIFPNGQRDTSFQTGSGFSGGNIRGLAVQPDGKILAVGSFTGYQGAARNRLVRLHQNGDLDTSFTPNVTFTTTVVHLRILPDGRILVFGNHTVPGQVSQHLALLNSNGFLQAGGSSCSEINGGIVASALLPDSSLLVGGNFSSAGGVPMPRMARVITNLSGQSAGLPMLSAGSMLICPGSSVFLSAAGALNGSQQWEWSTGGCGQIVILTGGPVVSVNPTATTTYYVRGIGNCLASGPCDSITVFVDTTAPVPVTPQLPTVRLACGARLPIASALDSCVGSILGTANRPLLFTQPGTYTVVWTYTDLAGNSSQQSQQVEVDTVDTRITQQGTVLTVLTPNAQVRWLRCDQNFSAISGATAPFYTVTQSGLYTASISRNGCTDTSACIQVNAASVPQLPEGWRVYPNPANERIWIDVPAGVLYELSDLQGRKLLTGRSEGGKKAVSLPALSPGIYLWRFEAADRLVHWRQQIH